MKKKDQYLEFTNPKKRGMGGHQSAKTVNYEWLTPPHILEPLGEFDLDPCSPVNRPWDTAKRHYNIDDNGLILPWEGRVWLNPPYGNKMTPWLEKMAGHRNGTALIFARTDRRDFQEFVFPTAYSILFIKGRLTFMDVHGNLAPYNGGAPSVLIAYSEFDSEAIALSDIDGRHVLINALPVITITQMPNWRTVVRVSMIKLNGKGNLEDIYRTVARVCPGRVRRNKHYREKVRQILQKYFHRVDRGEYVFKEVAA